MNVSKVWFSTSLSFNVTNPWVSFPYFVSSIRRLSSWNASKETQSNRSSTPIIVIRQLIPTINKSNLSSTARLLVTQVPLAGVTTNMTLQSPKVRVVLYHIAFTSPSEWVARRCNQVNECRVRSKRKGLNLPYPLIYLSSFSLYCLPWPDWSSHSLGIIIISVHLTSRLLLPNITHSLR